MAQRRHDLHGARGLVLTSGKTSRLYQRLVYEEQIATDAGAFALTGEIAGAYIVYATAAPEGGLAARRRGPRRGARAFPRRRSDTRRARAREDRNQGLVHPRHRASRRVRAAKSKFSPRMPSSAGEPDFYKHSLDVLNAATPRGCSSRRRAVAIAGNRHPVEVQPFPEDADRDERRRGSLAAADAAELSTAPFPPVRAGSLENGMRLIVAERHAVPVVQFTLRINAGYAADQFATPGVGERRDGDARRGHRDDGRARDQRYARSARRGDFVRLEPRRLGRLACRRSSRTSMRRSTIYADVILNPAVRTTQELERVAGDCRSRRSSRRRARRVDRVAAGAAAVVRRGAWLLVADDGLRHAKSPWRRISREDLEKFHETWFKPNNATMIVVGDTTLAEIQPKLEALFARWRPRRCARQGAA